ncbi:DUF2637 domain-containing protein [Streptomyces sp. NPDC052052]|uniref:DUF2637 domain-containing protein n=1 Tax=Streptomyces sp. NPDC052052 TaxID=3154756 RepID=UPI003420C12D
MAATQLTRTHRILIGVVVAGAVVIAGIGFAGSYAAVRELAMKKGFGSFSYFFPIGIDAGICVLLALDLLLTWIRMPFPLLRQTAWLLTVATVAFNAAASDDPLGMGMHAVIPVLFVVTVEAARHAVGRIADITADKHMEGVRITRWLLAPVPTFLLWRRMKLWELRSYDQVIKLEQERLVYQARLRSRFGRAWRRKAPVESLMPLRLARFGVPLAQTAPSGLAAAGIEPQLLPPQQAAAQPELPQQAVPQPELPQQAVPQQAVPQQVVPQQVVPQQAIPQPTPPQLEPTPAAPAQEPAAVAEAGPSQWFTTPAKVQYQGNYDPTYEPPTYTPLQEHQTWYEEQPQRVPVPAQRTAQAAPAQEPEPVHPEAPVQEPEPESQPAPAEAAKQQFQVPNGAGGTRPLGEGVQETAVSDEDLYQVFRHSIEGEGMPTPGAFATNVEAAYGMRLQSRELNHYMDQFIARLNSELMEDHIA